MEAEALFYTCCERIDSDMEVAESFLVNCIAYVIRDRGEKGVRRFIKEDLCMANYEPYIRELRFISTMHNDSLQALITSSLDIAPILRMITIYHDHVKDTDIDLVQPSTHANKAKKGYQMLKEIADMMKPTTKVKTDSSLFQGVE